VRGDVPGGVGGDGGGFLATHGFRGGDECGRRERRGLDLEASRALQFVVYEEIVAGAEECHGAGFYGL